MVYEYKYAPIQWDKGTDSDNPKDRYRSLFQATLDDQFYNSSNWWTVSEESVIGSEEYSDIDVRITHVINAETGLKLGDDWKTLLFKDVNHNVELGKLYTFDSNTWITVNTEIYKNLTGTCTIRRCNNTLRWVDEATGHYYEEPCAIEYLVKEPRNYATAGSPFITPGGFLHIQTQFNERTNLINENQRFLFGNVGHWTCYKVIGTGLNDFRNQETFDNTSAKILTVDVIADFVNNELDDVVNGIADVNTNVYTITLNKTTAEGALSDTVELYGTVTYNGKIVTRTITWTTDNVRVATVDDDGVVTLGAVGTATITGTIEGNPESDSCAITVSELPADNDEVRISPEKNYILEGTTQAYTVYLYTNDVAQADVFVITCNGNSVPSTSYTFTQTGNNGFSVVNTLRDDSSYLTITCTAGLNVKTFNIYLRGAW